MFPKLSSCLKNAVWEKQSCQITQTKLATDNDIGGDLNLKFTFSGIKNRLLVVQGSTLHIKSFRN